MGVHGKDRVRLTNNATYDYYPDFSPDGKKIVYYTGSHLLNPDIYTINVGGGGKPKVIAGRSPAWGSRP
jgi:Tol biopolymer transport system component